MRRHDLRPQLPGAAQIGAQTRPPIPTGRRSLDTKTDTVTHETHEAFTGSWCHLRS